MRTDVFIDFPILETVRCELVRIRETDLPHLSSWFNDESITRYLDGIEPLDSLEEFNSFISAFEQAYQNRFAILWGIRLKNTIPIIGLISLYEITQQKTANLFYALQPIFQNQGIMTECVHKATDFGFSILLLNRIEAVVEKNNIVSQKTLLKAGYKKDLTSECPKKTQLMYMDLIRDGII